MIYIAWVLTLIAAFTLGYIFRNLTDRVKIVEEKLEKKIKQDIKTEERPSLLIDPLDSVQEALWQQKKLMEKLNPHE